MEKVLTITIEGEKAGLRVLKPQAALLFWDDGEGLHAKMFGENEGHDWHEFWLFILSNCLHTILDRGDRIEHIDGMRLFGKADVL